MKLKTKIDTILRFIYKFPSWPTINFDIHQQEVTFEISDDFIRDFIIEYKRGEQTNFTTCLIRLIFKACGDNFDKLLKAYPEECLFIWLFQNDEEFYKQLNL